ncbi:hypothetical protein M406DRAFT_71423, partial [Cryphonectria parasitica EP155]
ARKFSKHQFGLRAPSSRGKDVANSNDLLVLLTFNFGFDTGIFSGEKHRVNLAGIYIGLACTGARPAEFVDNERKRGKDLEELFPRKPRGAADEDEKSGWLEKQLTRFTIDRGRPKALCWEDILLMVVRHPATGEDILAMSIKFAHHKGADNKPKVIADGINNNRTAIITMGCGTTVTSKRATRSISTGSSSYRFGGLVSLTIHTFEQNVECLPRIVS